MQKNSSTLFLYLARRDKKGIKIVSLLTGIPQVSKITNLDNLLMSADSKIVIRDLVEKNKMLWELWVHTANSYADLKQSLQSKGYTNLPIVPSFLMENTGRIVLQKHKFQQVKIMTQRKTN